jgi:hypothetical protein
MVFGNVGVMVRGVGGFFVSVGKGVTSTSIVGKGVGFSCA